MNSRTRAIVLAAGLVLLAAVPPLAALANQPFYLDLVRRIMIFAIAALSLNLILGYGGMISFGHAAYLGIGGYAVGVLAHYGTHTGSLQWALAIGASALVALVIGAISIRTSGVYFIMITLAFTQMLYYLGISIEEYGGDDGMRLAVKSQFPGLIDLNDANAFYYLVLAILVLFLFLGHRLVNSRFGLVIRAGASNRAMVAALGVNIRLLYTFVFGFGAVLAGLAGLMAGPIHVVQPGMGELILIEVFVVIVIGGIGSIRGALAGALIVGMVDTLGRAFVRPMLATVLSPTAADTAGPALASMLIYLLMAIVLALKPQGLFPARA